MQQILLVTAPFFALLLCGCSVARLRLRPLEAIPGLTAFVLFFALPCMLYRFAAAFPNSGFMGVPLLGALLGQRAAGHALMGMLKNPLPWSIGLGWLAAATGFELWGRCTTWWACWPTSRRLCPCSPSARCSLGHSLRPPA